MCILFIYRNPNAVGDSFKFILASNRDEFYDRPTKEAHFWKHNSNCIGGMDMEPGKEGGTWLAASTNGRVGVISNLSNEANELDAPRKGRGFLISDYINLQDDTLTFLNKLHKVNQEQQLYNPYNLVVADLNSTEVYSLGSYQDAPLPEICDDEILGFSNSRFPYPYKKVQVGKERFQKIVKSATSENKDKLIQELLRFLKCPERHLLDPELKKRSTQFAEFSSIFVKHKNKIYGTRTHTVILVDGNNRLTFVEETLMPDQKWHCQSFTASVNEAQLQGNSIKFRHGFIDCYTNVMKW